MADKVFPSSKTAAAPPAANGGTGGAAATTTTGIPKKSDLINPTARLPYRPPPRRRNQRPRRNYCCCCCCWTILIILLVALLAAITGAVLYVLYRPHRPSFTLASLRINRLKLKTAAPSSHLSTLFNLTLTSKNPNSHLTFSYDPFVVTCVTSNNDVSVGNGTLPAFVSNGNDESTFKDVVVASSADLDADTVNGLRSDLSKGNGGVLLKIEMDTKVTAKISGLKSKKVGIRVTCDGIKGNVPKGKSPVPANVSGAKCKVDLRIKIWKWTF